MVDTQMESNYDAESFGVCERTEVERFKRPTSISIKGSPLIKMLFYYYPGNIYDII